MIGVTGIGISLPEGEISHPEFAAMHGTTVENLKRFMGSTRICVGTESTAGLAIRAAKQCLDNAGVKPAEVDAIVWCSASRRHSMFAAAGLVQDALGAHNAFTFDLGNNCSEIVSALRVARGLIADDPELKRVLIVSGETWDEHIPRRAIDAITDKNHQNIMSDGGAAALIGPSEKNALIGFGFSTIGKYWDVMQAKLEVVDGRAYERCVFRPEFPDERQLALDLTKLFRQSLERCLRTAGITRDQIDHIVFPFSGPPMQVGFARALGLPPERVVRCESSPTHVGAPDMIHGLDILYRSGRAKPGQYVLIAARSIGIMRCAMMRV